MMLSFAEKRSLQRVVQDRLVELESDSLSFQQKRATQRELENALGRLTGVATGHSSSLYEDLVSGKFLKETPSKFLRILEEVIKELGEGLDPIKLPTLNYINENEGAILENAPFNTGCRS